MLSYTQYKPSKALFNYVECYWVFQASSIIESSLEKLIPGGRTEMIFNFGNPMQFLMTKDSLNGCTVTDVHVMGQRSQIFYTKQNGHTNLLGVRFKPGGFSAFTKISAVALLNQVFPAEDILDIVVKGWKTRLQEKKINAERIYLLDQLMVTLIKDITKEWTDCNKVIDTIRNSNFISVSALCNEKGSYYKKLERDFLKYVGYTPKQYYKIVRFNKAIRQIQLNENSLTSICYDCYYYDQSHFIKDFRQFTGNTPKHFQVESNSITDLLIKHQVV